MDGITRKIINGNRAAISLARTCISTPTLINKDITQGPVAAIPLDCETNQQMATAEVSESLVISDEAKKYVSDNIAPGSKSWNLSGYIPGSQVTEPSSLFQPTLRLNTDILWQWFGRGAVLIYMDGTSQIYDNVVIKSLQTAQQKDSANAVPFSMTLKEINVMDTSSGLLGGVSGLLNKVKKSFVAAGTVLGPAASLGTTLSKVVSIIGR